MDDYLLFLLILCVLDGFLEYVTVFEGEEGPLARECFFGNEYRQFVLIFFADFGGSSGFLIGVIVLRIGFLVVILVLIEVVSELFQNIVSILRFPAFPAREALVLLQYRPYLQILLHFVKNTYYIHKIYFSDRQQLNQCPGDTDFELRKSREAPLYFSNNYTFNKQQQQTVMEKLVRFRKAFYEKENDHHHHNKKKEHYAKPDPLKIYHSLPFPDSEPLHSTSKSTPAPNITAAYFQDYGGDLLEQKKYSYRPPAFLSRHQVDAQLRARMLDWMVEVTASYKFTHKSYFDGVLLMDRYFNHQEEMIPPTKLHVIGVQCMLIASKMEEVFPLKLRTAFERIAHKKIPMAELVEMEAKIMSALNFNLNSWSFFDFITLKLTQYVYQQPQHRREVLGELILRSPKRCIQSREDKENHLKQLMEICSYLSKLALYDYEFYCQNTVLMLGETIVSTAFEALGLIAPEHFFTSPAIMLELCKQKLLRIGKHYKQRFAGLNNILKFSSKEAVTLVDQLLTF